MTGFLPPSSSCTRRPSPTAAWILRPVALDPVNVTASTRSSATRCAPASNPCTTLSTPAGRPASMNAAASRSPISGVIGDGLKTTVLPGCQRRTDLATGEVEREVPRRDHADDADRIAHRVDERRVVARERGAGQPVRLAGVQLEVPRRARRLHLWRRPSACPPRPPSRRRCRRRRSARSARRGRRASRRARVGVVRRHALARVDAPRRRRR